MSRKKIHIDKNNYTSVIDDFVSYCEKRCEDFDIIFNNDTNKIIDTAKECPVAITKLGILYSDAKYLYESLINIKDIESNTIISEIVKNSPKEFSAKELNIILNANPTITKFKEYIIKIEHAKNYINSYQDGFKTLGWMIGHVSKLYAAEVQDAIWGEFSSSNIIDN